MNFEGFLDQCAQCLQCQGCRQNKCCCWYFFTTLVMFCGRIALRTFGHQFEGRFISVVKTSEIWPISKIMIIMQFGSSTAIPDEKVKIFVTPSHRLYWPSTISRVSKRKVQRRMRDEIKDSDFIQHLFLGHHLKMSAVQTGKKNCWNIEILTHLFYYFTTRCPNKFWIGIWQKIIQN